MPSVERSVYDYRHSYAQATQIMKAIEPDFPEIVLTPQRISALLRGLGKDGTGEVERYTEKRVTYFKKVGVEVEG